jgi:uncharacterized protein (DUF2141 family)
VNPVQGRISAWLIANSAQPVSFTNFANQYYIRSDSTRLSLAAVSRIKPVDHRGEVVFSLDRLDAGTYALSIVYDEDNNGKLNSGFLGIPTELDRLFILWMNGPLVGFSNNAKGLFGPPAYEKASFILSVPLTMDIVLGKAK